ncbi:PepSY-associated TM helix domain-containing protein [Bdellovibrio svalbardensis]|uniref:PepSY domain-containing protein n=1 Tax=Bdellovibrio svalbardensis TaxID=2972972 RepID=A0ABT6DIR9_9BACT|nr:PepSY-associated TM helix domain-containing protein [Bdellovibrio svalbardensis]MDG0816414.1 PepSY domain-containing protein [Bdellovibrio svalbardensis]
MIRSFRKWHRWISVAIALPFVITLTTGILLATRGFNSWVQPEYAPIKTGLSVSFEQILTAAQSIPEAKIKSWKDVSQIDIRPATGNIRLRAKNTQWEIQIDGATGQVTGTGIRRASFLTSLHEGAYFGPFVRYGVFLPSALGVFFLLASGIAIFTQPYFNKRKKKLSQGSTP